MRYPLKDLPPFNDSARRQTLETYLPGPLLRVGHFGMRSRRPVDSGVSIAAGVTGTKAPTEVRENLSRGSIVFISDLCSLDTLGCRRQSDKHRNSGFG